MIIAGLIGYYIGTTKISIDLHKYQPVIAATSKEPPSSYNQLDFSQFWTVMQRLSSDYYDKSLIDPQKFLNGAIIGMVDSLNDPYTMYLPPAKNDDFKQSLAGQFEGIGAELGMNGKQIVVVAPLDGSPANKAGLRAGDEILKVDSDSSSGWSLAQTVDKIRGLKGTTVTLTVLDKGDAQPKDIAITRDTITVKSITYWIKNVKDIEGIKTQADGLKMAGNDKVAYIRLSQFGDTANKEWQDAALKLNQDLKLNKDVKGVVLDLRNNHGGYLNDAVVIISDFVRDGSAVLQEDRNGDRTAYAVTGKGILYDVPLIVLINKGSASASEIVAGAMQDYKRGILVGETSFGKGTIQEAEDLNGAGLHITIAKWLTPNGRWIHKIGLTPDISVSLDNKDQTHDTQLERAVEELVK